ncbi:MAG: UDP-glucose 4-epimerase [Halioglobus sp.]
MRDFLFIGDFVSLCVSIANSDLTADKQCSTYNVGSDEGVELIELIQLAQELTGKTLQLKHLPPRDVDVRSIVLDSSKAKSEFDWRPETAMESGLVQTWNWLSER